MRNVQPLTECLSSELCAKCAMPLDARYFDSSSIAPAPDIASEVVLARFELPAEYCGVLEYFSQWTDAWAADPLQVQTPSVSWSILANRRPLDPYLPWQHIANPWGYGSFPVMLRLEESMTLELIARGVSTRADPALLEVPFSTMIASAITAGPSPQLVTPTSLSGIKSGAQLMADTAANREVVTVISVLPPSFAAVFQKNHTAGVTVSGVWDSKVTKVGGRLVGRYWYNAAYGDVVHRGR